MSEQILLDASAYLVPPSDDMPLLIDKSADDSCVSSSMETTVGRSPDFGINHEPAVLTKHTANCPNTKNPTSRMWVIGQRLDVWMCCRADLQKLQG